MMVASIAYKTASHDCGYKSKKSTPGSMIFYGIKLV